MRSVPLPCMSLLYYIVLRVSPVVARVRDLFPYFEGVIPYSVVDFGSDLPDSPCLVCVRDLEE